MSRESSIAARIRERLVRKRAELETVEDELAKLLLRKEAIETGIIEDENLIATAAPKTPRIKKTAQIQSVQTGQA